MTDKINDGGPAFPMPYTTADNGPPGMSLRDWFAGIKGRRFGFGIVGTKIVDLTKEKGEGV